ncbi:MAG: hypothetical protein WBF58_12690 [Xanthobacteraceae bacterium]
MALVFIAVGALTLFVVPYLLLPPMLRGVTAGGQGDPCHPNQFWENLPANSPSRPHGSPELNDRLSHEFPPGTPESKLVHALDRLGFEALPPCENNTSIHSAFFRRKFPLEIWARVYWKVDVNDAIVWTRGDVAYTFL